MMRSLALVVALGTASAAAAAPPSWTVDKPASRLGFSAAMSGQSFDGLFRRWDAKILFDSKALATSSVTVVVDTASAATGDATRDQALPTDDWFAAAAFPRATFTAAKFVDGGKGRYQAIGTLTIRNVRRPAVLPFALAIAGDVATMQGQLTIDRRAFGIGQGQFATPDTVAAAVRISVRLRAVRTAAPAAAKKR